MLHAKICESRNSASRFLAGSTFSIEKVIHAKECEARNFQSTAPNITKLAQIFKRTRKCLMPYSEERGSFLQPATPIFSDFCSRDNVCDFLFALDKENLLKTLTIKEKNLLLEEHSIKRVLQLEKCTRSPQDPVELL